jgi:class 3 adenylate cyclase
MPSVRRLTAILAADVAGYSWLMGADEEGTHERLRAHLRELVDPKIAEHRGRTVKNTGDGFLASTLASRPPFSVQTTAGRTDCETRTWPSLRVYRLAALTVGALIAARRRIGQASLSYRLRLRFVHAEHNMINCRLGGPLGRRIHSSGLITRRQARPPLRIPAPLGRVPIWPAPPER